MDVWVLRFLLTAREHLQEQMWEGPATNGWAGLQAVDRALPDADWFELEEVRERQQAPAMVELWSHGGSRLEF